MFSKISGILPSNSRITSVDIQNERPMRPGGPDLGLPIAKRRSLAGALPGGEPSQGGILPDTTSIRSNGPSRLQQEATFFEARRTDRSPEMGADNTAAIMETGLDIYA